MLLNKICQHKACSKQFITLDRRQKYCSKECSRFDRPNKKVSVVCAYCGKTRKIFPSRNDGKLKFCNKTCVDSWQKTCRPPATGNKQLAKICLMCNRGFKPEKRRIKYCSDNCRMQALHEVQTKEDHPSWRGGTVKGRRRLEITNEYKNWRLSVFKRDKYLCVLCGSNKDICVHHIKPLSLYPELGMALHNGATLCKTCHLKTYYKEERFEPLINKILLLLREVYSENMSPFIFIENSYASS